MAQLDIDQTLPDVDSEPTAAELKEHFQAMRAEVTTPAHIETVYSRFQLDHERTEIGLLNYRRFFAGGREWSTDDMAKKSKPTSKPIILRKMRATDVMGGAIKQHAPDEDGTMIKLYTVYGKARNVRAGTGQYGEFHALKGMFQAIREHDKQEYIAAECFLPEPMHDHIVSRYVSAAEAKEDPPLVEFAFEIYLQKSSVPIGYEYVTVPIVQPAATDDLADLRAKALEGPADETEGISSAQMNLGESA